MLKVIRTKSDWEENFQQLAHPSIYASFDYLKAGEALETGGQAELAVWEEDGKLLFHPYVKRPTHLLADTYDLISVYDFGGFWYNVADTRARRSLAIGFAREFEKYANDSGIVCEFIRFHPFSSNDIDCHAEYNLHYIADNVVVVLDHSYQDIWDKYPSSLRWAVRKAVRNGLHMKRSTDFSKFVTLYHTNLSQLGADEYYYFEHTFFERIERYLELYYVYDKDGELCGGHTYLRDGSVLFAYLCHAIPEKLSLRPNDFAYNYAIECAAARDFQYLHLGGGKKPLLEYKRKFSDRTVPYYVGKRIFHVARYNELVGLREDREHDRLHDDSFFPAYRA